jgi:hypothetical protein
MRDEHLERLYDHLHTNGMGRGGAGRNRDWRAFLKTLLLFFRFTHIVRKTALYALRHCLVGRDGKNEYPIFLFLTDTLYIVVHGRKLEPKQFMP